MVGDLPFLNFFPWKKSVTLIALWAHIMMFVIIDFWKSFLGASWSILLVRSLFSPDLKGLFPILLLISPIVLLPA